MAAPRRSAARALGAVVAPLARPFVLLSVVLAVLLAGCTEDDPQAPPAPDPVALSVETVSGARGLDDSTRTALETAIGEMLSTYVSNAFLGDFPRSEFVPALESFTSGAARDAARDIDDLTASPVQDATAVRATRLDARLSFLPRGRRVDGATAKVDFAFEATMPDGEVRPVTLTGRLMLSTDGTAWSVFGYDVALDDGAPLEQDP